MLDTQGLDELTVDQDDALAACLGRGMRGDDAARPGYFLRTRGKGGVGRFGADIGRFVTWRRERASGSRVIGCERPPPAGIVETMSASYSRPARSYAPAV
jgi:hypothetical protein